MLPNHTTHRFIHLRNGSLLIVHARQSDAQPFRCVARNQLASVRPERSSTTVLRIVTVAAIDETLPASMLLPALQSNVITVSEGHSLDLVCAGRTQSDVVWSASNSETDAAKSVSVANVLRLINVTTDQAGRYNCSSANDFQVIL